MALSNYEHIFPQGGSGSGSSTSSPASSTSFTPTDDIEADNTQDAIVENRTELEQQLDEVTDADWESIFTDSLS